MATPAEFNPALFQSVVLLPSRVIVKLSDGYITGTKTNCCTITAYRTTDCRIAGAATDNPQTSFIDQDIFYICAGTNSDQITRKCCSVSYS